MTVKLVAFDLDGTLAPSKGSISFEMAETLRDLLRVAQVCIVTGGGSKQIFSQVVSKLPKDTNLRNLHLMPTTGSEYLKTRFGSWKSIYTINLKPDQQKKIEDALVYCSELLGLWPEKSYGQVIDNRGCQITFSALGQEAPEELKLVWDTDGSKKESLRSLVATMLPEFEVRSGGSTSIDVTRVGIDKGFAIRELSARTNIKFENMVFIGDRLDVGGNDYPVISTGVYCKSVSNPDETLQYVKNLIKTLHNN